MADGESFVTRGLDRKLAVFQIGGGEPRPLAGALPRDLPIVASGDDQWLYVQSAGEFPAEIARVNPRTGQRETVRTIAPADPAGAVSFLRIVMTPDARAYAYTFLRALLSLYLVDGLR
jgi:hypothetical protein